MHARELRSAFIADLLLPLAALVARWTSTRMTGSPSPADAAARRSFACRTPGTHHDTNPWSNPMSSTANVSLPRKRCWTPRPAPAARRATSCSRCCASPNGTTGRGCARSTRKDRCASPPAPTTARTRSCASTGRRCPEARRSWRTGRAVAPTACSPSRWGPAPSSCSTTRRPVTAGPCRSATATGRPGRCSCAAC